MAHPALWDLAADKQAQQTEQPLQVARCTKIIGADTQEPKYIINVKQFAKFVVDLGDQVNFTFSMISRVLYRILKEYI